MTTTFTIWILTYHPTIYYLSAFRTFSYKQLAIIYDYPTSHFLLLFLFHPLLSNTKQSSILHAYMNTIVFVRLFVPKLTSVLVVIKAFTLHHFSLNTPQNKTSQALYSLLSTRILLQVYNQKAS